MNGNGVIFPACLRETDKSGKLRTRDTKTEVAYRKRFGGMTTTLAKKLGEPHVEIDQVIDDLRARAPWLKKRSYYLYRAVILQVLRDLYLAGCISDGEVERLVGRMKPADEAPVGSKRKGKSKRRRHFRPATQGALVSILRRRSSETARNLADMLDFGPEIGVRVCEFFGCRLVKRILWVSSAKYSEANERGIAEFRPIELLQFNDQELGELADLIARLNCELEAVNGDRSRLVRRYSAMMRRVRDLVPSASSLTIGATRHQFRANLAAAGYSREEISAAMGHAVVGTAETHYGRKSKGWYPNENYRPISVPASVIARVRAGAKSKPAELAGTIAHPADQPSGFDQFGLR
jgi:integrase